MNIAHVRLALAIPVGLAVGWAAYQIGYVTAGLAAPAIADQGPVTWPRLIAAVPAATTVSLALTWTWGLKRHPRLLPITAASSALISGAAIASLVLAKLSGSAHLAALILATLGFLAGVGTTTPWQLVVGGRASSGEAIPGTPNASHHGQHTSTHEPERPPHGRQPRAQQAPPPRHPPSPARPATPPPATTETSTPPAPRPATPTGAPTLSGPPKPSPPLLPSHNRPAQGSQPTPGARLPHPATAPASAANVDAHPQHIPTTTHPVHDEITRIAERLARHVAPLLLPRLQQRYGAAWPTKVAAHRRSPRHANQDSLRDYRYCLAVFADDPATKGWATRQCRHDTRQLVQLAHEAAHRRRLTTSDQERARRLADDITKALQAVTAQDVIRPSLAP